MGRLRSPVTQRRENRASGNLSRGKADRHGVQHFSAVRVAENVVQRRRPNADGICAPVGVAFAARACREVWRFSVGERQRTRRARSCNPEAPSTPTLTPQGKRPAIARRTAQGRGRAPLTSDNKADEKKLWEITATSWHRQRKVDSRSAQKRWPVACRTMVGAEGEVRRQPGHGCAERSARACMHAVESGEIVGICRGGSKRDSLAALAFCAQAADDGSGSVTERQRWCVLRAGEVGSRHRAAHGSDVTAAGMVKHVDIGPRPCGGSIVSSIDA